MRATMVAVFEVSFGGAASRHLMPMLALAVAVTSLGVDGMSVIPCNTTTMHVASNTSYELSGCVVSGTLGAFLSLSTSSSDPLQNVSVVVKDGNVFPLLTLATTALNVTMVLANVTSIVTMTPNASTNPTLSLVNSFYAPSLANVSVVVDNCTLLWSIHGKDGALVSVAPLMFVSSLYGSLAFISVLLRNSTIRLTVGGVASGGFTVAGLISITVGDAGDVSSVSIRIVDSSVATYLDTTDYNNNGVLVNTTYVDVRPSLCSIRAAKDSSRSTLTNVTFVAFSSTLNMHMTAPGITTNSSDFPDSVGETASIVSLQQFSKMETIRLSIEQNTSVAASCVCGKRCGPEGKFTPSLLARVFEVSGNEMSGAVAGTKTKNVTLIAVGAMVLLVAPLAPLFMTTDSMLSQCGLVVTITDCVVAMNSSAVNVGMGTRNQALIEVSSIDRPSNITISVVGTRTSNFVESGGCLVANAAIVSLLSVVTYASVHMSNVTMLSTIALGTVSLATGTTMGLPALLAATFLSSAVNVSPLSVTSTSSLMTEVHIRMTNVTIEGTHGTSLPAPVASTSWIMVSSIVTAVNIIRPISNAHILLANVTVLRRFPAVPGPTSSFPSFAVHFNITAVVSLLDATSTITGIIPLVSTLISQALGGGTPPPVTQDNVTCIIEAYSSAMNAVDSPLPTPSDLLALVILPVVTTRSTIIVRDVRFSTSGAYGSPVGAVGTVLVEDSTIQVERVVGMSMLLWSALAPLTFSGTLTTFVVKDVTFHSLEYGIPMQAFAIGAVQYNVGIASSNGSIVINTTTSTMNTTTPPLFNISHNTFVGFRSMLMPGTVSMSSGAVTGLGSAAPGAFFFGCNVWNNKGATIKDIVGSDVSVVPWILFPKSTFNTSVACRGSHQPSSTPSITASRVLPAWQQPAPDVPPSSVATVVGAVGVMGAASAALLDAQMLVALGRSVCAPAVLRDATSASQFLLSPFYVLGNTAAVLGNVGLLVALIGSHRLLVHRRGQQQQTKCSPGWVFRGPPSRVGPAAASLPQPVGCASPPLLDVPGKPLRPLSLPEEHVAAQPLRRSLIPQRLEPLRAEVALRFPNQSITFGLLLAPGVANAGAREVFTGTAEGTATGLLALITIAAGIVWRVHVGRSRHASRLRFRSYSHAAVTTSCVPWALPVGQWGPAAARATHGRLRGAIRPGAEWLSANAITLSLIVQIVSGLPVPVSWCVGVWALLCGIQLTFAAVICYTRPGRSPLSDVTQTCGLLLAAAVQLVAGLSNTEGVGGLDTLLLILTLCTMSMSSIKMVHVTYMFLWERGVEAMETAMIEVEARADAAAADPCNSAVDRSHITSSRRRVSGDYASDTNKQFFQPMLTPPAHAADVASMLALLVSAACLSRNTTITGIANTISR